MVAHLCSGGDDHANYGGGDVDIDDGDDNFDEYDDIINFDNDDDDVLWWRTFAVVASRPPSPVSDHRETSYKHLLRQTVPSSSICTIFIFDIFQLCETITPLRKTVTSLFTLKTIFVIHTQRK